MFSGLDNEGTALLRLLISRLAEAVPSDPETFITYKEVHTRLGLQMMGLKYGASLQLQGMNSLAGWLGAKGLPAITGLIVAKETRIPENTFFTAHGHDPDDFLWWEAEIARAKAYDWLSLEQSLLPKNASVSKSFGDIGIGDLLRDKTLNEEARRIADLVFGRVTASGYMFKGVRPTRSAPSDFLLIVAEKLKRVPLACALCEGLMQLQPSNKLLQPSADRIDSNAASYGPENFQLVHLACNLGKNNATAAQFEEWLQIVKSVGQGKN